MALCLGKLRLLLRGGVFLVALLPFRGWHAVDNFAGLTLIQNDPPFARCFPIPIAQAVTAEAGEIYHVDVLDVGARTKMRDQAPESSGFQFGAGFLVHERFLRAWFLGPRKVNGRRTHHINSVTQNGLQTSSPKRN